jgi:hypothetical protein
MALTTYRFIQAVALDAPDTKTGFAGCGWTFQLPVPIKPKGGWDKQSVLATFAEMMENGIASTTLVRRFVAASKLEIGATKRGGRRDKLKAEDVGQLMKEAFDNDPDGFNAALANGTQMAYLENLAADSFSSNKVTYEEGKLVKAACNAVCKATYGDDVE